MGVIAVSCLVFITVGTHVIVFVSNFYELTYIYIYAYYDGSLLGPCE